MAETVTGGNVTRPSSILMFERLYLASVAIGLVNAVLNIATAERLLAANPATQGLGGGSCGCDVVIFVVTEDHTRCAQTE